MQHWILLVMAVLCLSACSSGNGEPSLFLPHVTSPEGADLDALRARYCQSSAVDLHGNLLTTENFNGIFRCANYDGSLESLKPLITSQEFPDFLRNMNLILQSNQTGSLRETLRGWLEEGPAGSSRIDRLLPMLSQVIRNPSFQDSLPVLNHMLDAGKGIWPELLPGLAEVIYQERFPDNLDDAFVLFGAFGQSPAREPAPGDGDYAKRIKDFARFAKSQVDGKSVSMQVIELVDGIRDIHVPQLSLYEYVDQMNEKDVLSSLILDGGAARGEEMDPKLNADADEGADACEGLNDTIEQRQACAYRRLFRRPDGGGDAPIVQLAGIVAEFQTAHPEFLPSLARWFSANGSRLTGGLTDYVVRAQVISNISKLNVDAFLLQYATGKLGWSANQQVSGEDFSQLLRAAFASPDFAAWLGDPLLAVNSDALGSRNAQLMKGSSLAADLASLYTVPEVAGFATVLLPEGKKLGLTQVLRRFTNLHRTDKLIVDFGGSKASLEDHLLDLWVADAKASLGESVVVDFAVKLAQTFFTQMANNFGDKGLTLSEWYFASPYGNPGTTEAIAGYAVKDLGLLPKYYKNLAYLKNDFANEVFTSEDDKRAFRLLMDQIPNIYTYVKSGMARSGQDMTRALALKDRGYLIRNYVGLIAAAQNSGWIRKGARLIEAYQFQFPFQPQKNDQPDDFERQRKVSMGVDAMKRVLRSLFQPATKGAYDTCTMSRIVQPVSSIVTEARRAETERLALTTADVLLEQSDEQLNRFFRDLLQPAAAGSVAERRGSFQALSELLKDPHFPDIVQQVSDFFHEDAVKPALDFLAKKIDDGSLHKVLLFLRRVLGFRG